MNDTCLDGSSVALNELTNRYVRVESGSIILLMGSAKPSGGTPQLLNSPPGRCPSRSIGSGGPMASPRWRFYGFGSGFRIEREKVETSLSASERGRARPLGLVSVISPWLLFGTRRPRALRGLAFEPRPVATYIE